MSMIERGQQVAAPWPPCPEPRKVLPSTAITRRSPGVGAVRSCAHSQARSSNAAASSRCKVRRNVDSDGATPFTPSLARVCASASAAHSAIAVNDRAPASTAHTASPKITASRWRTPRRCRGSAILASTASRPGESSSIIGKGGQMADNRINRG